MSNNKIFVHDVGRMTKPAMKAGLRKKNWTSYNSEGCI